MPTDSLENLDSRVLDFGPEAPEAERWRITEEVIAKRNILPQKGPGRVTGSGESSQQAPPGAAGTTRTLQDAAYVLVNLLQTETMWRWICRHLQNLRRCGNVYLSATVSQRTAAVFVLCNVSLTCVLASI
ncbi:hypothetical protein EYF80_023764 [Liparis tanakae]|uniref:Uncharacterized protein n=1 Tax=Liparis tanakae TaxID=230148 RepID=A0A4Z2HJL6_9TELE|nr:hypothetical protein EYF80_023764 [Liparis tanakae]